MTPHTLSLVHARMEKDRTWAESLVHTVCACPVQNFGRFLSEVKHFSSKLKLAIIWHNWVVCRLSTKLCACVTDFFLHHESLGARAHAVLTHLTWYIVASGNSHAVCKHVVHSAVLGVTRLTLGHANYWTLARPRTATYFSNQNTILELSNWYYKVNKHQPLHPAPFVPVLCLSCTHAQTDAFVWEVSQQSWRSLVW